MLGRRNAPGLDIIFRSADPILAKLIEANFLNNKLLTPVVINAIAGDHSQADARFSLNPASTLDNRVNIAHWEQINVPMLTIDEVMSHRQATGKTFFKIDTQGFELQVLRGMERSEEHTSELQSLMRISYAVFCFKKK